MAEAEKRELALTDPARFEAVAGRGIRAQVEGRAVLVGKPDWIETEGVPLGELAAQVERLQGEAKTVVVVAVDGQATGVLGIADTLKEGSAEAVAALHRLGLETVMLTGDNRRTAEAIARHAGFRAGIDRVLAEVLPQDKAEEVKKLQAMGRKVAMVGDGVNDAPALARADVGMAIGSGTDVAKETGDVILIKDDLRDVIVALQVARATMRKVKQNLFWAFIYNSLGIPVAAGLLYPFVSVIISPELAGLLMAVSSVTVTLNTLLLRGFKPSIRREDRPQRGQAQSKLAPMAVGSK